MHHLMITSSCGDNNSQFLPVAVPTITNLLEFTQGSPSSTLTCTSTTSIATTVTFMRDGNAINGIMRDGDSATVNGVTYQLSQTLTNRIQSTYDNVLTITEPLSSLAGSTFTCQVENALGMSVISDSLQILGKTRVWSRYVHIIAVARWMLSLMGRLNRLQSLTLKYGRYCNVLSVVFRLYTVVRVICSYSFHRSLGRTWIGAKTQ